MLLKLNLDVLNIKARIRRQYYWHQSTRLLSLSIVLHSFIVNDGRRQRQLPRRRVLHFLPLISQTTNKNLFNLFISGFLLLFVPNEYEPLPSKNIFLKNEIFLLVIKYYYFYIINILLFQSEVLEWHF